MGRFLIAIFFLRQSARGDNGHRLFVRAGEPFVQRAKVFLQENPGGLQRAKG